MTLLPAKRVNNIAPFYVMELLQQATLLEQQGHDIIHMEIGEPDFKTPATIVKAGIEAIQSGEVRYTPAAGLMALRAKIAGFYGQQYGLKLDPKRIFITPGASGALLLALAATLNPGDSLLIEDPSYPCNRNFVELFSAQPKAIPVDASTHYHLNADLIAQHWEKRCKGVLVASPANPTGMVMQRDVLQQVISQTANLGGYFFSDEIYQGMLYGQSSSTALQWSNDVFVINSFSKFFGMTGWRIGWLVVPETFTGIIEKLIQNMFIATSTPAQYAALAAFDTASLQELTARVDILAERRDFLYQHLIQLGFDIPVKPEGAFYIYANCSRYTQDSFQFAHNLLQMEGVAITPGKDFGSHAANHCIRLAYTTPLKRIAEAIQRLEHFIQIG